MLGSNSGRNKLTDRSKFSGLYNEFINTIIPTTAASSFKVNGNPPISSFLFKQLGTSKYSYMQLDAGPYNTSVPKKSIRIPLTAEDGFNALVLMNPMHTLLVFSTRYMFRS